jgi:hypothetical protein
MLSQTYPFGTRGSSPFRTSHVVGNEGSSGTGRLISSITFSSLVPGGHTKLGRCEQRPSSFSSIGRHINDGAHGSARSMGANAHFESVTTGASHDLHLRTHRAKGSSWTWAHLDNSPQSVSERHVVSSAGENRWSARYVDECAGRPISKHADMARHRMMPIPVRMIFAITAMPMVISNWGG